MVEKLLELPSSFLWAAWLVLAAGAGAVEEEQREGGSAALQNRITIIKKQHQREVDELENEIEILKASSNAQASQLEAMARAEKLRAEQAVANSQEEIDRIEQEAMQELERAEAIRQDDLRRADAKRQAQLEELERERLADLARLEKDREMDQLAKEQEMKRLEEKKAEQLKVLKEQQEAELKTLGEEHLKEKRALKAKAMQKDLIADARQKQEQDERRVKWEPLVMERDEIADTVRDYMKMLGILPHEIRWKDFEKKHCPPLPAAEVCKDADVAKLQAAIPRIRKVMGRLKERVESDAILLALREIAKRNAVKAVNLVQQMTSGQKALKDTTLDPKEFVSHAQIQHFLTRQGITYTDQAWTYLLQSLDSGTTSKKPIKIKKLASTLDGTFLKVETA